MAEEIEFLNTGGVRVTSARFIQGARTFALSGITSVRLASAPPKQGAALLVMAVGGLGFFGLVSQGDTSTAVIFGVAFLFGVIMYRNAKASHRVMFATAGGEVAGLETPDRAFAESVLVAINEAIVYRG